MWSSIRFSNNPRAWLCASIVSIDKKDGDPLNPGDKRGIALINVGLKLVCKAFDTVPVGALLWKLQNMGFPRRTLAFLKALYTSHLLEHGRITLSDPFQYREVSDRDVHCLDYCSICSSTTFSMVSHHHSPWTTRDTNPIRGLMYADDVAVFADSEQSLLAASTAIEQWANRGNAVWCGQVWHHQLHWPSSTTT
ncbi:hypothetical protein BASA83_010063 [Batrachochytrium salamandrivorans]|nr:hypothetical protein BASA83_010063 [Batrachochytrium salamandrivorans]